MAKNDHCVSVTAALLLALRSAGTPLTWEQIICRAEKEYLNPLFPEFHQLLPDGTTVMRRKEETTLGQAAREGLLDCPDQKSGRLTEQGEEWLEAFFDEAEIVPVQDDQAPLLTVKALTELLALNSQTAWKKWTRSNAGASQNKTSGVLGSSLTKADHITGAVLPGVYNSAHPMAKQDMMKRAEDRYLDPDHPDFRHLISDGKSSMRKQEEWVIQIAYQKGLLERCDRGEYRISPAGHRWLEDFSYEAVANQADEDVRRLFRKEAWDTLEMIWKEHEDEIRVREAAAIHAKTGKRGD